MSEPDRRQQAAQERRRRDKIQRQLDEALAASFPASDPVSIVTSHAEEDWGADAPESEATEPSTRASSPPDSRS